MGSKLLFCVAELMKNPHRQTWGNKPKSVLLPLDMSNKCVQKSVSSLLPEGVGWGYRERGWEGAAYSHNYSGSESRGCSYLLQETN